LLKDELKFEELNPAEIRVGGRFFSPKASNTKLYLELLSPIKLL